ncbi:MAG: aminotransferase class I/II-fold pyridoxal phosphate-dependent enzyme [Bacteroidales bacterium]|nr:aminotransferase class I/II-fold pyridoxal phosphate-dependent enzyme [Bacteroidales bacterium]
MIIQPATRTESVKEYYFSKKNREIAAMNADGRKEAVINLGIGSPNGRPPQAAIDTLCATAIRDGVHAYQPYVGTPELRKAFADWYARWYEVELDPSSEIQPLTGSKEGILITSMAFLNPGDKVLVPDPGYPTYSSSARLCEAEIVNYDLVESLGWQPDLEALEAMDLSGVKMMWTNYPNMPTGAPADPALYERLVDFGRRHGILICNDNPYSFILTDKHYSILAVPGAKECCLELNSLSKAHNMAGWRLGMVAASGDVIYEILKVKSQLDSGIFRPLQMAAVEALAQGPEWFASLNEEYTRRRVAAGRIFDALGVRYNPDSQGLFLWGRVPEGVDPVALSDKLLHEAGVFITPGFIFGKNGENYLRVSLCATVEVFGRALEKIKKVI